MIKQAKDYDPNATYIKLWCPELSHIVPLNGIFMPWTIKTKINYPPPMVLEPEWSRHGNNRDDRKKPRGSDWKLKK